MVTVADARAAISQYPAIMLLIRRLLVQKLRKPSIPRIPLAYFFLFTLVLLTRFPYEYRFVIFLQYLSTLNTYNLIKDLFLIDKFP